MSCMILLKNHIVSAYSSLADNNAEYDFIVQRLINCNDLNELHKEIEKIISSCLAKADEILIGNKHMLKLLSETLVIRETLDGDEVRELLGFKPKDAIEENGLSPEKQITPS